MPYSDDRFDTLSEEVISKIPVRHALDIGAGAGKYGRMLRRCHPSAKLVAVEIDPTYVDTFGLNEVYNDVLVMPADRMVEERWEDNFDLSILGDCLEHMRKSEGRDLLEYLIYRSRYILVVFPDRYVQAGEVEHPHEAHVSVWQESDFVSFDSITRREAYMTWVAINGYLLQPTEPSVQQLVC